jgi:hypothetical protein
MNESFSLFPLAAETSHTGPAPRLVRNRRQRRRLQRTRSETAHRAVATAACSLHIRVWSFAAFGYEAVDPRSDNRQRY